MKGGRTHGKVEDLCYQQWVYCGVFVFSSFKVCGAMETSGASLLGGAESPYYRFCSDEASPGILISVTLAKDRGSSHLPGIVRIPS